MAYATVQDMIECFGEREMQQLSDRNRDGENDAGYIESKLDDATSEIDSYIATKYNTPITSISKKLLITCCDIARYLMHKNHATDEVDKRYTRALSWLRDLSSGKAVLTDQSGSLMSIRKSSTSGGVKSFSAPLEFPNERLDLYG